MSVALSDESNGSLALAFVSTIRHDGAGGIADDFAADASVRSWVTARWPTAQLSTADCEGIRDLRRAARAAFAATVSPAPPSRADASRLMDSGEAGRTLEAAIGALQIAQRVRVSRDGVTSTRESAATGLRLARGTLALAVIDFLTGAEAGKLRSCQAPRCVRYFIQRHGRQRWCKDSCGNRARAAKFSAAHRVENLQDASRA